MDWLTWMAIDGQTAGAVALVAVHLGAAVGTTLHVLITKDSTRAAAGWAALAWLSPLLGSVLYLLFGINRVQRKASTLRRRGTPRQSVPWGPHDGTDVDGVVAHLGPLRHAIDTLTETPLVTGNRIVPLDSGEQAFPAMLAAIDGATSSIALMTFIFDRDPWGLKFVDALARARARGVQVRLLIDGVGTWFSWPPVLGALRRAGVPYDRFLWSWNPLRMTLLNLRNHRKVLVVDGTIGFTGGMNVQAGFVQDALHPGAHRDLHFQVEGPVVQGLMDLFADDWAFETGEDLCGPLWFPTLDTRGDQVARVIPDGPDEDLGKAELTLLQAVTCADRSVVVVTPYFLPEDALQAALIAAVMRGVSVDIVVPARSNQPMAAWAMHADVLPLLDRGVRVWAQPAPFDHTKLMVVDGTWSCVGSANWDPRSLRLNFEMLLEAYGPDLAQALTSLFEAKRARSTRLDADTLRARSLVVRARDGAARLFKPYL